MCDRFVLDRQTADLVDLFDVDKRGDDLPEPSWNIAPTQAIRVVIDSLPKATDDEPFPEPLRRLEAARWGLVPGWAKDPSDGPPLISARGEDAATHPAFANAVKRRRAVVPATGFYAWRVVDGARVPQFISLPGDEVLVFAGLYEWWRNPAAADGAPERWLLSASILTRPASGALAGIHERMPVFLEADLVESWLDPQEEGDQELIDEAFAGAGEVAARMQFHEVGRAVESVQNDGEQLTEPVA
jgi:putative SOS response-associated peptidase YedK